VADWSAEIVPAVAVKLADVEFAGTDTDAGTVSAAALLERVTVAPPAGAAFDNVTVQELAPPGFRLVEVQETELTMILATREMEAFAEVPL